MRTPRTLAAFTLIELLVVISIIAVLMSILLPALKLAGESARMAICGGSGLRQIHLAMEAYANEHYGAYQTGFTAFSLGYIYLWNYPVDIRQGFDDYITDAQIFYCPSGGAPWSADLNIRDANEFGGWNNPEPVNGGRFSYQIWPSDEIFAGGNSQTQWVTGEFEYKHVTDRQDIESASIEIIAQDFAWTDTYQQLPGMLNHPFAINERTFSNSLDLGTGFNNCYYDGHVAWRPLRDAKVMMHGYGGQMKWFR